MSPERFSKVLSAVKPHTKFVYLHLMGEPLLNPELETFLILAKEQDITVQITTNGTLLQKRQEILLNAPALRQINISLSSFEANLMNDTLMNYLTGVCDFVNRALTESEVIISLRLWNMDSALLKAENQLNLEILSKLEEGLCLTEGLEKSLSEKPGIKLKERLYLNRAEKFAWPDITQSQTSEQVFCYGLRDHVGILVDGTVVPCCLDSGGNIALGNIFETPLQTILESERVSLMYEGFSNRKAVEDLCKKCGYAQRF